MEDTFELEESIVKAAEDYYLGVPTMADEEFDRLVENLRRIQSSHPLLTRVGWGIKVYGEKVKLPIPIQHSLPKVREYEDGKRVVVSPKIDGISSILTYRGGTLVQACTRGDGEYGVDITTKIGRISRKLTQISLLDPISIRGEIYIDTKTFQDQLAGEYANPRNAVAGIVNSRGFDNLSRVTFKRHPNGIFLSATELLNAPYCIEFWDPYSSVERNKEKYIEAGYPIDGLVIQPLDDFNQGNSKNIVAFKFENKEVETTVTDIEWNLSHRGRLIPTVIYEPVQLYGTTCSRATGLHYQYIKENKLGPGSRIKITKNNEIIPGITEVLTSSPFYQDIAVGSRYYRVEGVHLVSNDDSKSRYFDNFLDKHFNFKGFKRATSLRYTFDLHSYSQVDNFLRAEDYYDADYGYSNYGDITYSKIRAHVEKIKQEGFDATEFFSHFGITGVGKANAKLLEGRENLEKYIRLSTDKAELIFWLGSLGLPSNVVTELNKDAAIDTIKEAYSAFSYYLNFPDRETSGPSVCITGKLTVPKSDFHKMLEEKGMQIETSVKKDLDYLICAEEDSTSNKAKKARKLGITVLNEIEVREKWDL